jgi:hypothetical protein
MRLDSVYYALYVVHERAYYVPYVVRERVHYVPYIVHAESVFYVASVVRERVYYVLYVELSEAYVRLPELLKPGSLAYIWLTKLRLPLYNMLCISNLGVFSSVSLSTTLF